MLCVVLVLAALCLQADQVAARVSEERLCADPACSGESGYSRPLSAASRTLALHLLAC